jgi:hypothetical protein
MMTTESRAWTVEELLGVTSRLADLFCPKTRVELTVGKHSGMGAVSVAIWVAGDAYKLKLIYGETFEEVIPKVELYAAEWVMSNRTMTADDLGIAA